MTKTADKIYLTKLMFMGIILKCGFKQAHHDLLSVSAFISHRVYLAKIYGHFIVIYVKAQA